MVDEAVALYVKATGRGRSPDAPEAREHEARRIAAKSRVGEHAQRRRSASKTRRRKRGSSSEDRRGPRLRAREEFEKDFRHHVMRSLEHDKSLQEWTEELRKKAQEEERRLECRKRNKMEQEDHNSPKRWAWEKTWEPRVFFPSPYLEGGTEVRC